MPARPAAAPAVRPGPARCCDCVTGLLRTAPVRKSRARVGAPVAFIPPAHSVRRCWAWTSPVWPIVSDLVAEPVLSPGPYRFDLAHYVSGWSLWRS